MAESGTVRNFDADLVLNEGDRIAEFIRIAGEAPIFRRHVIKAFRAVLVRNGINRIRELAAPAMDLVFGEVPFRPELVMPMQADKSRLRASTGWAPRIELHEGLADPVVWRRTRSARRRNGGGFCDSWQSAGLGIDFCYVSHPVFVLAGTPIWFAVIGATSLTFPFNFSYGERHEHPSC
jgi:hypothetical protein